MAINAKNIRYWYLMLIGQSVHHVHQNIGTFFDKKELRGYYNNLTEKVTKSTIPLNSQELPKLTVGQNEQVYFPVAIFQYGLGAYDLYLQTKDKRYLDKFYQCVRWSISNIDDIGRWNNFFFYRPDAPYGAMAQGEGASLLIRAYTDCGDIRYLELAKKAIDFMLLPIEEGGTTKYYDNQSILLEYTFKGMVMNGTIFAWWGLYDYVLATKDDGYYKEKLRETLESLMNILPMFKGKYWSMYSLDGLIASPFYHNLHIAQMEAMFELTGESIFNEYALLWKRQQKNIICCFVAFVKKAIQKIKE